MSLGAVITYCSFEKDLIEDCIKGAACCDAIHLVVPSHFFDGTPDPDAWKHARELAKVYPNVNPIYFTWRELKPAPPARVWHNEARLAGFAASNEDWLLFIDADEITRDTFKPWFDSIKHKHEGYKLANYWYFLSKRRRAKQLEDSVVLVRRSVLRMEHFRDWTAERETIFAAAPIRSNNVQGPSGPMFDHYSWVRPKDVLLRKCSAWGHRSERDWASLITKAFEEDILTTRDFVHGYEYDIVEMQGK